MSFWDRHGGILPVFSFSVCSESPQKNFVEMCAGAFVLCICGSIAKNNGYV